MSEKNICCEAQEMQTEGTVSAGGNGCCEAQETETLETMVSGRSCCCTPEEDPDTGIVLTDRKKHRSEKESRDLMNRLKRIEGQVRGVQKMLENDAYCPDILVQVSAINSALNSFSKTLLASHMRSCVIEDIRSGREESIDELVETLQKVMK